MNANYQSTILKQLRDQQVRFAPRDQQVELANRAERLLAELDPARTYPYDYLAFRITDARPVSWQEATPEKKQRLPESYSKIKLTGEQANHDLRLFVEDLTDAAAVSSESAGEEVLTVEELAKKFNVSTKTISRWRQQGLVSRRFVFDGRKRLGFLRSSVERFVGDNTERVKRGSSFSQMSDEERDEIVSRARRLSAAGGCPSEVARRVAEKMHRSVETVRYTLKQFDQENPALAVFPSASGPLSDETKQKIYEQFRRDISIEELAKRYSRTKTSIYRIVNEMRAKRILELPLDYISNPYFGRENVEKTILGPMPENEQPAKKVRLPAGLPPYLASLYEVPLLNREQEGYLFRKFNYLKYKATKLRLQLDPTHARASLMDEIERLYDQAVGVKNQIVRANLRLVVSIAKRHVGPTDNFFELVSDGNMSLIRAAEKFDYARGNKFSTYASWAIMKNFARTIPDEHRRRDRFRTSQAEMFGAAPDGRTDQVGLESAQNQRVSQIGKILERLDEREQKIIVSRFGLDYALEPLTLKEVGQEMGVTKERVRQIEARALAKLRLAAQDEKIEVPGE
jgi:RNA polymerase sigma factor (sigma-70 family)